MINADNKRKGFALIASIGILAVLLIIVFGVAAFSAMSYNDTKNLENDIKINLVFDYALNKFSAEMKKTSPQNNIFNYKFEKYDIKLTYQDLSTNAEEQQKIKDMGLLYKEGDKSVLVELNNTDLSEKEQANNIIKRNYIVNLTGARNQFIQY